MTKSKPDDEDYWNNSKFNAFTFDDEDEVSRVRDLNRFRCWSVLDSRMSKKNELSEEDTNTRF